MSDRTSAVDHRIVGEHTAAIQKYIGSTNGYLRKHFTPFCSCGWRGEFARDRGEAETERDAHLAGVA